MKYLHLPVFIGASNSHYMKVGNYPRVILREYCRNTRRVNNHRLNTRVMIHKDTQDPVTGKFYFNNIEIVVNRITVISCQTIHGSLAIF